MLVSIFHYCSSFIYNWNKNCLTLQYFNVLRCLVQYLQFTSLSNGLPTSFWYSNMHYCIMIIYTCICNTITIPPRNWCLDVPQGVHYPVPCNLSAVKSEYYHIGTNESNLVHCLCVKYDERSLPVHKNQDIKYSPPRLHIITKIPTFWEASLFFLQNNIYVYNITYLIQSSDCILFINGQWPVILEKYTVCEGNVILKIVKFYTCIMDKSQLPR